MDETREIDIDLRKIIYMMRTKIIFVVLITILAGVLSGCFTHFFIDPTYSATVNLFVYSNTDRVTVNQSINKNELDASQDLVGTYVYIIQRDTVLDKVAQDLNLGTAKDIRGMVKASSVEGTLAFQVTVTTKDPNLSAKIANAIAKIAPEEIVRVVKAGGVEVIDYAKVPTAPSSPNLKKNIIIGALAGFILSFAAFFIYEIFDSTITNAKDLENEFEIPVLGTIPRLEEVEPKTPQNNNPLPSALPEAPKPSASVLQNIQSMKGGAKNDD